MQRADRIHALLATARVANLPSVVSNVWLGAALGNLARAWDGREIDWASVGVLMVAGMLLYLAGNFLNDWQDRTWDGEHRPERGLPRGLFTASSYWRVALSAAVAGVSLATTVSWKSGAVGLGIVGCIWVYTHWHKRYRWAVIPMGLCRGLLPVMGFMAFSESADGIGLAAAAVFTYIVGLSLTARYESLPQAPKVAVVTTRFLLLGTALLVGWRRAEIPAEPWMAAVAVLPYLLWASACLRWWRRPIPRLVSRLLAGIPLVDAVVLLQITLVLARAGPGWDAYLVACCAISPLAFISALFLQRLAPAT
jgi:4-hydroxybenzoate polyprenyltransferase